MPNEIRCDEIKIDALRFNAYATIRKDLKAWTREDVGEEVETWLWKELGMLCAELVDKQNNSNITGDL